MDMTRVGLVLAFKPFIVCNSSKGRLDSYIETSVAQFCSWDVKNNIRQIARSSDFVAISHDASLGLTR